MTNLLDSLKNSKNENNQLKKMITNF